MELRDPRPQAVSEADERPFAERAKDALTGGDAVPPVVAPPTGHPRFPLVDGVRALAALAVVTTHAGFSSNASATAWYGRFTARLDVGVAIFFAIAGFLLFRPYLADYVDGLRAPSYSRYLFRRGLRVLPAYWIALSILALIGLVTLDSRLWEQYGLVQIYDSQEVFGGIVPAWSLATEVAFYAALPLVVTAIRWERSETRAGRLRTAAWMTGMLWATAIVFRLALRDLNGARPSIWFNALPGTLDWFAVGMGFAVLSVAARGAEKPNRVARFFERRPGVCWLAAAGLFTFVSLGLGATGTWGEARTTAGWLAMHVLYGLIAALVLAPAAFPGQAKSLVHLLLDHPLLSGLGVISYGVFLYNGPIAVWLSRSQLSGMWAGKPFLGILLGTVALTIPAAALSYRLIERPLLKLKDWRLSLPAAPVPAVQSELERPAG